MIAALLWLAGLALLTAVGLPLLSHPAHRPLGPAARIALSFGAGAVITAWLMTVAALLGVRWEPWWLLVAGAAVAAGLRSLLPRGAILAASALTGRTWAFVGLLAGVVAVAAAWLCVFRGASSSPDLLYFWGVKGQRFGAAHTLDAAFLREPFHGYMHPDYPPLLPNLYALATMVTGRFSWEGATLLFPLLLAATLAATFGILRLALPSSDAATFAGLLTACLAVLGIASMFGGIGEMPLLFFEVSGVALLCGPGRREPAARLLAGLLLSGAATTKLEGVAVAIPAIVVFPFTLERRQNAAKALAAVVLPTLLAISTWIAFGRVKQLFETYGGDPSFREMHLSRLPIILSALPRELFSVAHGLPFALPLLVLVLARPPWRAAAVPLAGALGIVLFAVYAYAHGSVDPREWIAQSAIRVLSPAAALLLLAAASRERETSPPRPDVP